MKLHWIDFLIICAYLVFTVVIGLMLKKRAEKDKSSYLLGSNELPWYMLGLSNASGMFDISGTMWLVTITFVYGLKSVWIPWLWPVFNQIFLMVFLATWLRRSNVTTGAEWIGTRFGNGKGASLSHNIVVIFALMSCLGFLAYGFIGLGKFMEIFIPWESVAAYIPFHVPDEYVPHLYGIVFTAFSVFYTILGGMVSVVWADVFQYIIMGISAFVVATIAMLALWNNPMPLPDGWYNPFFGISLNLDWSNIITEVNAKIASDGYSLFSVFFMLMLFKGILASAAGPAPNYDMQKVLSTRSPKEAAKMSGFVSIVLMPVRYIMIAGFVVLGLIYFHKLDLLSGKRVDFEKILPSVMHEFVPVGMLGLMLAGLLAAFIGTFAGTLNAAQAYIVNDIYLKHLKPKATNKEISFISYITGIAVVSISIVLGIFALDINSILQWIVSALYGSYVVSNVLKWYWWRFNGYGYFWGMLSGMIPALIFPKIFNTLDLYYFPLILLISLAGAILGTYTHPPTEEEVLKKFYKTVRPWGFWKPIHDKVVAEFPDFVNQSSWKKDMLNVLVGILWQTTLVLIPIYLVVMKFQYALLATIVMLASSFFLKKNWYDRLTD